MTFQEFLIVKQQFDNGEINIQNAHLDAFLYNNKWYPIRSFVNQVYQNINNHNAIKTLVLLIPYLRIKENVNFEECNNYPIEIDAEEKIYELKLALKRLNDLTS